MSPGICAGVLSGFAFDDEIPLEDAILNAVDGTANDPRWGDIANEFRAASSARRLELLLDSPAAQRQEMMSRHSIITLALDIRLGRHHDRAPEPNTVDQSLVWLCSQLLHMPDAALAEVAAAPDPEVALALDRDTALDLKKR